MSTLDHHLTTHPIAPGAAYIPVSALSGAPACVVGVDLVQVGSAVEVAVYVTGEVELSSRSMTCGWFVSAPGQEPVYAVRQFDGGTSMENVFACLQELLDAPFMPVAPGPLDEDAVEAQAA